MWYPPIPTDPIPETEVTPIVTPSPDYVRCFKCEGKGCGYCNGRGKLKKTSETHKKDGGGTHTTYETY